MSDQLHDRGYVVFDPDPAVQDWLTHARAPALAAVHDPAHAGWLRCGGTWFAGVDALANDGRGRVAGGPPLSGAALDLTTDMGWDCVPLHPAQISVIYPGYPRPMADETKAAFRYRTTRDAAHVDGLLPEGPDRRRHLREPHGYILGLPLTQADPDASPLVVWDGSHRIMADAFSRAFAGADPAQWPELDITAAYQAARRSVFDTCARVPLPAGPGQAILLHRHTLHGIAPWASGAKADPEGRAVIYFRPELTGGPRAWMALP